MRVTSAFRRQPEPTEARLPPHVGYVVRLDWRDGSHSFVCYKRALARVERKARATQRYWQRSIGAPTRYQIAVISRHEWKLHARRGQCRAPDCVLSGPQRSVL